MEERGREHHVISRIPELRVVLSVEYKGVSDPDESESRDDCNSQEEVHEQS